MAKLISRLPWNDGFCPGSGRSEAAAVGGLSALRRSSRPPANVLRGRHWDPIFEAPNLRPDGGRLTPNMLFQPLEENTCGVPEEEVPISDVTREHGVRGMPRLLSDLERRDARPSCARR